MIACASARAPGKADNSPFPELFALRRSKLPDVRKAFQSRRNAV